MKRGGVDCTWNKKGVDFVHGDRLVYPMIMKEWMVQVEKKQVGEGF